MTEFSKWVFAASADDPVNEVAARTLTVRLAAVQHFLPLAAERSEEDIEYVHQLRVATRRCVAALRLYRKILPKLPRKTLCRELKSIRQAAGRARDYDVLILHHSTDSPDANTQLFLQEVRKKRCEAQQPLREINRLLAANQQLHQLPQALFVQGPNDCAAQRVPAFGSWAKRQLRKSFKAFFRRGTAAAQRPGSTPPVSHPRQGTAVRHGTTCGRLPRVLPNPALSVD